MSTPKSRDVYVDRMHRVSEYIDQHLDQYSLLRDWLPSSGLQLDSRPMFEHYPVDSRYDSKTGVLECKLCVPVMPL